MTFEKANINDAKRIWQIILQAKEQMRRLNSVQWGADYPTPEIIHNDIAKEYGYVLRNDDQQIVAYGAVVFDGEPAYATIEGEWLDSQPYVVVHRLAVADEAKRQGLAVIFMHETAKLSLQRGIYSFRVDTNYDNLYMQKAIEKSGFVYCGQVYYERGSRMAYAKLLRRREYQDEA